MTKQGVPLDEYLTEGDGTTRVKVTVVLGVGGAALYVNDTRVAGCKPWGGGRVAHEWTVDALDLSMAMSPAASPAEEARRP